MANKNAVRVEGVREVQKAMKDLSAASADLKAAHMAVASQLVPGIALRTPRQTGALAGSWKAGATKTRARLTSDRVYAGIIEYGWSERGIEPAGMIAGTVAASGDEIIGTYTAELEKLATKEGFETKG